MINRILVGSSLAALLLGVFYTRPTDSALPELEEKLHISATWHHFHAATALHYAKTDRRNTPVDPRIAMNSGNVRNRSKIEPSSEDQNPWTKIGDWHEDRRRQRQDAIAVVQQHRIDRRGFATMHRQHWLLIIGLMGAAVCFPSPTLILRKLR